MADATPQTTPASLAKSPALRAVGLGKVINERRVLSDVSIGVSRGESVALMGANGAGKSTLLRIFATLIGPSTGTLELFGQPAGPRSRDLRSRVGVIGHQLMLYRDLTPLENLELFGSLYRVERPERRAMELLGSLGVEDRADDPVRTLSRGMAQRVAIARALMHDPDLLLADEPFTGLDQASASRLEECLHSLHAAGRTLIIAHHDVRHALSLCERALVIRDGRIALDAPSARINSREALMAMGGCS